MAMQFEHIRAALEEHLLAINENTGEIQALFDYLHEMESKMEKLSTRLDALQLSEPGKVDITPLDQDEKRLFLTLYTEQTPLSYQELAQKVGCDTGLVIEHVSSLVRKGVPLQRSYANKQLFFTLDPQFKEMQAKENLVNLSLQSFI